MLRAGAAKKTLDCLGASPTEFLPVPPQARALVLDDGTTRIALVSADIVGILNGSRTGTQHRHVDRIRKSVADQTGIANILIVATHDHSAPSALAGDSPAVLAQPAVDAITQAIVEAHSALTPAEVAVARGEAKEGFNRVRRVEGQGLVNYVSKLTLSSGAIESYDQSNDRPVGTGTEDCPPRLPGTEKSQYGLNYTAQPDGGPTYCNEPNPAWIIDNDRAKAAYRARHPLDPMDDEVIVVYIRHVDTRAPIATLINYALHGVVITQGTNRFSHGEWSGAMMSWVEGLGPFNQPVVPYEYVGGIALFLQGAAGDVDPWWTGVANPPDGHCDHRGIQAAIDVGSRIGVTVVHAVKGIADADFGSPNQITMNSTVAPVWPCGIGGYNIGVPTVAELNVIAAVGPTPSSTFALGTFPGEFFTEYGLALKAQSRVPNTMFVGYTNDHIGYIPGEDSWMSGAYGTTPATGACLVKGTGNYLLKEVLGMLHV